MFIGNLFGKLKIVDNMELLLTLLIIFISNDTCLFGTNSDALFLSINRIVFFILCIQSFFYLCNKKLLKKYLPFILGLCLLLLLTIIFNLNFSGGFIQQFVLIIIGLYFINKYSFTSFCFYFERIVYFLSYVGLFFFVINIISGGLSSPLMITNSTGTSFSHFFVWSNLNNGLDFYRNTSIFREPGVYMIYIIFAMLINLYIIETEKKHFGVLLLALISTLSTAGIIIGCIVISLYFSKLKGSKKYIVYILLAVILFYAFPFIEQTEYFLNVMGKFNSDNDSYASFVARQSSVFVPLEMAKTHVFGVGFSNFPNIYESVSSKMYGIPMDIGNSTNLITNMIARFGWLWGIVLIKLIYNLAKKFSYIRSRDKWIIFLVICLCFFNEDVWNSYIFTIFILFGLKRNMYEKNTYNFCKSNNR